MLNAHIKKPAAILMMVFLDVEGFYWEDTIVPNYRAIRGRTLFNCKNGNVANNLINNVVIGWGAFRLIAELDTGDDYENL